MIDIVERLRIRASDKFIRDYPLMIEAADEIERLRGYAERLEGQMEQALPRLGQLENEIERLRAALETISRMSGHPDKVICLATLSAAKRIAEDALNKGSDR